MRDKKNLLGLAGVVGIWLSAGFTLPFVNVLDEFTPTQLMVFRGFLTALMAFIGLRGIIGKVDKYTHLIALILPFATLGLFQGIRYWGAGPTIIVITATPVVNFAIGAFTGRRISRASIIGLVLVMGGVVLARWGGDFQWAGFLWSAFGTLMNGLLYELFARAKSKPLQKCLWGSLGMGTLGLLLSLSGGASWEQALELKLALTILLFVFVGGLLYWIANLVAFDNLPTGEASVLAQGETLAVIIGAGFLLGESLTSLQWVGVLTAIVGAGYLARWLAKQAPAEEAVTPSPVPDF